MTGRALRSDNDVVITGMGIVSALGQGADIHASAFARGVSGVTPITRFNTAGLRTTFAAQVKEPLLDELGPSQRTEAIASMAADMAIAHSGWAVGEQPIQLVVGLPPVQLEWSDRFELETQASTVGIIDAASSPINHHLHDRLAISGITERLAARVKAVGVPSTVSTACSTGATAIIMATEAIQRGSTDAAIVVAADSSLSPEMLARFGKLSALSKRNDAPGSASRPFDANRDGFVPGEGAGALILETRSSARRRGAECLSLISGFSEATDGHHRLRHEPEAKRISHVMSRAIARSGLTPSDISYVNAHGTSTQENDLVEFLGCASVFGSSLPGIPVSSIKSMIGHTLSAAGIIEAIACTMMLRDQIVYPTINVETPDPRILLDIIPDIGRDMPLEHILSNSFGFGGQNACLVISRDSGN